MGFGFNLIGFPLLLLATVGLLILFFKTRNKTALKILGGLWCLTILLLVIAMIKTNFDKPVRLPKGSID